MCQDHPHGHTHEHDHGHAHSHDHAAAPPATADVRRRILASNDEAAAALHARFQEAGTLVVDLVSSPGAGKTTLLEHTARRLASELRMGALVGDVATELDAERLRRAGLPAHQIITGGACHLDARLVEQGLEQAGFGELDLLFLENVGNLVCPASYALGEDFKVALLSVTEGEDKPFKYPAIFAKAGVTLITKLDLAPHVPFDLERAKAQIYTLNPMARVVEVSTSDGRGLETWCDRLVESARRRRGAAALA
jgi:hydrogenase nickel incorporation protein HypB